MINLEWYRTFKAIYQNGTLTKAAEELLVSQPNVSIQLASLEAYIGHPLFIRLPRKMEPTEYGKRLYTQIIEPIDNLEKVEAELKKSVLNKIPTIRLGTPSEIFLNYMAGGTAALPCNLDVKFGEADKLTDMLADNQLDVAIITRKDNTHEGLSFEPIVNEEFRIVCNTGLNTDEFDRLVGSDDIANAEKWLKKCDWYAYSANLPVIRRFWKENFNKRPVLKVKAVIPDYNSLLEAVSNGNALTVASDLTGKNASEADKIKILWKGTSPVSNTLYLSYNKSKIQPDLLEVIREFVKTSLAI